MCRPRSLPRWRRGQSASPQGPEELQVWLLPEANLPGPPRRALGPRAWFPLRVHRTATDTFPPPGGLLVFENGKEIFRMKPSVEQGQVTDAGRTSPAGVTTAHESGVQRASIVEPAGVLELPPDVAEASLLHRVEPDYPEEARQQRIQGAVVLSVRIAQDGGVQSATLVSGPPLLAQAASDAVKQWRFKPRLVGGRPAEMQTSITLDFRLPRTVDCFGGLVIACLLGWRRTSP